MHKQRRSLQDRDYDSDPRYDFDETKKDSILQVLIKAIKREPFIKFTFLHGSFLENLPFRDIDIAVFYQPELTCEQRHEISTHLSVELTKRLGIPVDVHPLNDAALPFCYHATAGTLLTCQDPEEAYEYVEHTRIMYMDFLPLLKQNLQDLLQP